LGIQIGRTGGHKENWVLNVDRKRFRGTHQTESIEAKGERVLSRRARRKNWWGFAGRGKAFVGGSLVSLEGMT